MRRYAWLLLAALVLGGAGVLAARTVRWRAPEPGPEPPAPVTALAFVLGEAGLEPAEAAVAKDHRVTLELRNERKLAVTIVLQGYDDRFLAGPIAPGATWRGEFVADRPGEAFAWLADGAPVGRLAVTGSHLTEGHR
jgi:hypothetical protein